MTFNGPGRELQTRLGLPDEVVYCVNCGTIYVWDRGRDCPACTLNEKIEHLWEHLDTM